MAGPSSSSPMPSTKASTPQKDMETPPSSPPSEGDDGKKQEQRDPGISETMRTEEEKMRQLSMKDETDRQKKMEAERKKDMEGGSGAVDSKFKALEYLLSQSKVGCICLPSHSTQLKD